MTYFQFSVEYEDDNGGVWRMPFVLERNARKWINARADGSITYTLSDRDGVIVRSAFPVLQVA